MPPDIKQVKLIFANVNVNLYTCILQQISLEVVVLILALSAVPS